MPHLTTTAELIESVRREWAVWDAFVAGLDPARLTEPTNAAGWTIKDVIAHLTWFERETVALVRSREFVGSELWLLDTHERNAAIFAANRDRILDDVRAENQVTRIALLSALATLSDADLDAPERCPPMPAELMPIQILEDNTWLHYEAHRERLEAWLVA
jgi:uncharacterized protein (TIGR03083 family)